MKKLIVLLALLIALPVMAKDVTLAWDHDGECDEFKIYRSQELSNWPFLRGVVDGAKQAAVCVSRSRWLHY